MSRSISLALACLLTALLTLTPSAPAASGRNDPGKTAAAAITKMDLATAGLDSLVLDMSIEIDVAFDRMLTRSYDEDSLYRLSDRLSRKIDKRFNAIQRRITSAQTRAVRLLTRLNADQSIIEGVNLAAELAGTRAYDAYDQLYSQIYVRLEEALVNVPTS